ncbi:MAG: response regulator [Rhizobiales bacterium]|nr:response regulator [Hyphomicrobiales bacterium]NRB13811.1 response regulator [Hyphomicrobiales bacterium]
MEKTNSAKTDMPNYDQLVGQSLNYKRRGWGFVLFVFLLSVAASLIIYLFDVRFTILVNIILTSMGIFGLTWFVLFIVGYARFGYDEIPSPSFAGVADGLKDAVIITANDGSVVYSNDSYIKLALRANNDNSHGENAPEIAFYGNSEISDELYNLANAARNGQEYYAEMRLKTAGESETGKPLWIAVQVTKVVAGNFKGGALWQMQDISNRSARQELMINKLRQTIDNLDDAPIGFLSSNPDGEITFMNTTLARWLGGKYGNEFEQNKLAHVVGDNGSMILSYQNDDFDDDANVNVDQSIYVDFIKLNGESFAAKILHRVKVVQGEVEKISSFVMPEKNLNDKLGQVSPDVLFSRFFNYSPLGMAALDENGVILSANPAFNRMFSQHKTANNKLTDLVSEDSRPTIERVIEQSLVGKIEAVPIDFTSGVDDRNCGQIYFNRVRSGVGKTKTGKEHVQLIAYLFDTTEQRTLEAQFSQGQKMQAIGQLAGGIAHDFNNVLTAILGNCELLLSNIKSSDPSFPDLMGIKSNANRAAGLVGQLLAFSRRQTLRPTLLVLSDLLSEMRLLFDQLKGKNVAITIHHGRDLGWVKVDHNQLEQVLMNLVVNAGHAMPQGGKVTISTENVSARKIRELDRQEMEVQDYVQIKVVDTGTGMTEEVRSKIFLPFYTTKKIGQGTGLGLSTAYGIIKQTGGYIYVDSQVGVGTEFNIYLPRQYPDDETLKEMSSKREKKTEVLTDLSGKGTILLVDDEEGVRSFAVRALQARGYDMLQAENGVEALKLLNEYDGQIDLIISDVMMPEMDGPTMYNSLPDKFRHVTTIFMSGYAEEVYRDQIAENANVGFLSKPVGIKKLAETVKLYMSKDK